MPLYKAQQITKDCFAQEMTEMAEIMMWFFEFRFWVLPLQLPKKEKHSRAVHVQVLSVACINRISEFSGCAATVRF